MMRNSSEGKRAKRHKPGQETASVSTSASTPASIDEDKVVDSVQQDAVENENALVKTIGALQTLLDLFGKPLKDGEFNSPEFIEILCGCLKRAKENCEMAKSSFEIALRESKAKIAGVQEQRDMRSKEASELKIKNEELEKMVAVLQEQLFNESKQHARDNALNAQHNQSLRHVLFSIQSAAASVHSPSFFQGAAVPALDSADSALTEDGLDNLSVGAFTPQLKEGSDLGLDPHMSDSLGSGSEDKKNRSCLMVS